MPQDLTIHSKARSSTPVVASRDLTTLVDRLSNRLESVPGGRALQIRDEAAPTASERTVLAARCDALDATMAPAPETVVLRAVGSLLAGFPSAGSVDEMEAGARLKLYVRALESFPTWAINDVCSRVLEGRAGLNPAFAPTPAQLAELCRAAVLPFREERGRIHTILTAEVYSLPSEDERKRVAAGMDALKAELKGSGNLRPYETPEQALAKLAASAAVPVVIGEGLAKKLGTIRDRVGADDERAVSADG